MVCRLEKILRRERLLQQWRQFFSLLFAPCLELLDWKIRYDESDNVAVRLLRGVTEKISGVFGIVSF